VGIASALLGTSNVARDDDDIEGHRRVREDEDADEGARDA